MTDPKIILTLTPLEASVFAEWAKILSDYIENRADIGKRESTDKEELGIDILVEMYGQILKQSHKIDKDTIEQDMADYKRDLQIARRSSKFESMIDRLGFDLDDPIRHN